MVSAPKFTQAELERLILQYFFFIAVASAIILLLFKYSADIVVWFVLITVVCICTIGTVLLWRQYSLEVAADRRSDIGKRRISTLLVLAIIATIVTIGVSLMILVLRKRIQLVIRLFQEAGKVVTKMPLLLFEPILVRTIETFFLIHLVLRNPSHSISITLDVRVFGYNYIVVAVLFRVD